VARGKGYTPDQIVNLLLQIEVAVANGKTTSVLAEIMASMTYRRVRPEALSLLTLFAWSGRFQQNMRIARSENGRAAG
jgi:hypothetical protein